MESRPIAEPIARQPAEGYLPPVDADAHITISDDEQSAYLGIRPPSNGGQDLSYEKLMAELERRRVVFGIDNTAIQALAVKPQYNTMVPVARGIRPVQGSDAKLTFHFSLARSVKPRERQDGTVDYRDLGLIEAVRAGQALCTLTPAVKGTPGKTVTGRVIVPEPVRSLNLPAGKNTRPSEDRLTLLAAVDGCVEYLNGKVHVNTVFTVNGNVCNATGNIQFNGTVVVNGDVQSGFAVKAAGSISVVGNVEGAVLDAGGDIKIVAGLVGQGRGRASCGGNFKALFVENAEVFARGDVAADVFLHARVRCGGSLIADGKRGAVIGGTVMAGRDVKVLTAGSPSNVATAIELGIDPAVMDRLKTIRERERILGLELPKLDMIIRMLQPLRDEGKLNREKAGILDKALATRESHESERAALDSEREELAAVADGASGSQFFCRRDLYCGTRITICQVPYTVTSDCSRCRIYLSPSKEIAIAAV